MIKGNNTNIVKVYVVFSFESRKKLKVLKIIDNYNHNMNSINIADQLYLYYNMQKVI